MRRLALGLAASVLLAAGTACSGGNSLPTGPSPVITEVLFEYSLSPETTAALTPDELLACRGRVRLYPSWWGFSQVRMVSLKPHTWAIAFDDVPVGSQSVRVSAPEGCNTGGLTANGLGLDDPQSLTTFHFYVQPDGSVARQPL